MTVREDWGDTYSEELEARSKDFKNESAKFYSEEETDKAARNLLKALKKK